MSSSRSTARQVESHTAKILKYTVLTQSPLSDTVNVSHADKIHGFVSRLLTEYGPLLSNESRTLSLYAVPQYCKSSLARIRRHMHEIDIPPTPPLEVDMGTDSETADNALSTSTITPDSSCLQGALLYAGLLYAGLLAIMADKCSQRYSGLISRIELLDGLSPAQESELHLMKNLFRPAPGRDLGTGTSSVSMRVHLGLYEYAKGCSGQLGVSISTIGTPALMHGIAQSPGVNPEIREECNSAVSRLSGYVHARCDRLEETLHGMGY